MPHGLLPSQTTALMITPVVNTTPIYNPIKSIICLEVKQKMNRTKVCWLFIALNALTHKYSLVQSCNWGSNTKFSQLYGHCWWLTVRTPDLRMKLPNQSMWISKTIQIWPNLTKKQSFWQYKLVNHYIDPMIPFMNFG